MVDVGVNRFSCIGYPVFRTSFDCGNKVNIVAINDPFIDLNYMVCMFQCDSTYDKFNIIVKAENGKFIINRETITLPEARSHKLQMGLF
ncbi:hypothetical protein U0070_020836 [Myodes glareolus]|uniref:glyceraldehyde-3-phosphate dehydrogenase (phosphorylating) n=1 Tax=Myodes glareolus TaxID=447135 RepID=A0AAW0IQE0_MYOGA